jgi:hypothetical protein
MLDKVNIKAETIGRKGGYSHLCRHIARSHTQNWYRDEDYRTWHMKYGGVPEVEGNELQRELGLLCPWCKDRANGSQVKANMRHLHMYCVNEHICKTRETTNDCLEDCLKEFVAAVDQVKKETVHSKDLIGDINKFMQDIPLNDCALPGCEHPLDPPGAKITLSRENWSLIRADSEHPLYHQATN